MQATMTKTESDWFDARIKEGNIYIISNFEVTNLAYNTVSTPCTITISRQTKFTEFKVDEDIIHTYYFQLLNLGICNTPQRRMWF